MIGFVAVIERKKDCREGRALGELDGAVSLKSVSSSMPWRRGGVLEYGTVACRFLVFFILDPETRKNKLNSPSFFPLLCRFTRKIRRKNPDSTIIIRDRATLAPGPTARAPS